MRAAPRSDAWKDGGAALAAGAVLVGAVVLLALVSLAWTPFPPTLMAPGEALRPPGPVHLLGTDAYGRDVASGLMAGARTALLVSLAASLLGLGAGVPLGVAAAGGGGWLDEAVMGVADLLFAFPALLVAMLLAAAFGPGALDAVVAIGLYSIPVFARVARAGARRIWSLDYAGAARAAGRTPLAIARDHLLPNLLPLLVVQLSLQLSLAVVAEAGLAFLGLSAQPPAPSWGRMLAEAQTLSALAPWLVLAPGAAIVLTVLGFTLLGEGLRRRWEAP